MHVIPSVGGGTLYQSDDNLIGDAEYLKGLKKKPDFVVIYELLPIVYPTGTTGHGYELDVLEPGIEDIKDAAAKVKIAVGRILSQLPETTQVIYPTGKKDEENLKILRDMLTTDSAYHLHLLVKRMVDTATQSASRENIIEIARASQEALEKTAKKDEKDAVELANVIAKIEINKQELAEFQEREKLLGELFAKSVERLNERSAARVLRQVEEVLSNVEDDDLRRKLMNKHYGAAYAQVSAAVVGKEKVATKREAKALSDRIGEAGKKLKEAKPNSEEFEKLQKEFENLQTRAKFLANKGRVLGRRKEEQTDRVSMTEEKERLRGPAMFTHNVQVTPEQRQIIKALADSYYTSELKNVMGRRKNVTIQKGIYDNYAFKKKDGSFDVVVASSLDNQSRTLKKMTNAEAPTRLARYIENTIGMKEFDLRTDTTFFIVGNNMFSHRALDGKRDWSHNYMYTIGTGTAYDVPNLAELAKKKIRTRETEAVERGFIDSSVTTVTYTPKTKEIQNEVITDKSLKNRRRVRDITVEKKAISKILDMKNGKGEQIPGTKKKLEELRVKSMLPSELLGAKRELSSLRGEEEFEEKLRAMAPYADSELPEEPKLLKAAVFGDVHIGNHSKYSLIRAAVKDAMARNPDVVILNGDIIEGNLANFKNAARSIDLPGTLERYQEWMKKQGMSEEKIKEESLNYLTELKHSEPVYNIDAQMEPFLDLFGPLMDQTLMKGGSVILTAGNHYNMTFRQWELDEGIRMRHSLSAHMKAHAEDGKIDKDWPDRVKTIAGSEYGAGDLKVNDVPFHIVHKFEDSETNIEGVTESKRLNAAVVITSHFHKNKETKTRNILVIETLPMKDRLLDTYLARIRTSAHTTEGYVWLELDKNKEGEVLSYRTRPIIDRNLIARGMLEENPFLKFVEGEQVLRPRESPQAVKVVVK